MNVPFRTKKAHFASFLSFAILLGNSAFSLLANAEQPAEAAGRQTTVTGTPIRGSLTRGEVLPKRGTGFSMISITRERRARFGVPELISLIKESAFRVHRQYRKSVLFVGDLSERQGGPIEHHGSHQNGLDVDILFYLKERDGSYASTEEFISIDPNGFSTEPPMKYVFDDARNWALVSHLLSSKKATIQWIFAANHIKKRLLDYAESHGAKKSLIQRARQVIHQPSGKPHVDHFHLRIYCPSRYEPACKKFGPTWAWVK